MVSVFRGVKPELIHFLFPANLVSAYLHPFPLCVCWHCLSFITWFLFSVPSSSLSAGLTWSHNACLKVLNAYFLSFLTGGVLLDTLLSAKLSTVLELHIKYLFVLLFFFSLFRKARSHILQFSVSLWVVWFLPTKSKTTNMQTY